MELEREKRKIQLDNQNREIYQQERENEELRLNKIHLLRMIEEQKRQGQTLVDDLSRMSEHMSYEESEHKQQKEQLEREYDQQRIAGEDMQAVIREQQ